MKLIQLNAWAGRLERQLLNFVKEQDPDIICLQEIVDIKDGQTGLFASVDEIAETMTAEHIFMSPVFTMNFMHRKANFGNCIISKFEITKKDTVFTGKEYIENFDWSLHSANMRNLQHAVIKLPSGKYLNIMNHHGHHIDQHKNGDAETMRQCRIIAEKIKELDSPTIVTGDFNLAPHSESIEQINNLLDNLSIKYGLKTTRNALTHKTEVCDYAFVSKDIKVNSFEASDEIVSDHMALIVDFEL